MIMFYKVYCGYIFVLVMVFNEFVYVFVIFWKFISFDF